MKPTALVFVILVVFSAQCFAKEEEERDSVQIVHSESTHNDDGSYNFEYEGSDGTIREEAADLIDRGTDEPALRITGSYKYIDDNGDEVVVTYTADENGFVPVGSVIPKEITDVAQAAKDLPKVDPEDERPRRS